MKEFTLHEVAPQIYWAEFEDAYTLCMAFFRYQEFYESPDPLVKNHVVPWLQAMELYSKQSETKGFSYAADWGGFNIPSRVIEGMLEQGIKDHNKYDYMMLSIHALIRSKISEPYYLIGTHKGSDIDYLKHEIAHGFFYTREDYRKKMSALVSKLPDNLIDKAYQILLSTGYCEEVLVDETQAYLSTGTDAEFDVFFKLKDKKPFEDVFKQYYEQYYNQSNTVIW